MGKNWISHICSAFRRHLSLRSLRSSCKKRRKEKPVPFSTDEFLYHDVTSPQIFRMKFQDPAPTSRIAWLASALELRVRTDPALQTEQDRERAELEDTFPRDEIFSELVQASQSEYGLTRRDQIDLAALGDLPLEYVAAERWREDFERESEERRINPWRAGRDQAGGYEADSEEQGEEAFDEDQEEEVYDEDQEAIASNVPAVEEEFRHNTGALYDNFLSGRDQQIRDELRQIFGHLFEEDERRPVGEVEAVRPLTEEQHAFEYPHETPDALFRFWSGPTRTGASVPKAESDSEQNSVESFDERERGRRMMEFEEWD